MIALLKRELYPLRLLASDRLTGANGFSRFSSEPRERDIGGDPRQKLAG